MINDHRQQEAEYHGSQCGKKVMPLFPLILQMHAFVFQNRPVMLHALK